MATEIPPQSNPSHRDSCPICQAIIHRGVDTPSPRLLAQLRVQALNELSSAPVPRGWKADWKLWLISIASVNIAAEILFFLGQPAAKAALFASVASIGVWALVLSGQVAAGWAALNPGLATRRSATMIWMAGGMILCAAAKWKSQVNPPLNQAVICAEWVLALAAIPFCFGIVLSRRSARDPLKNALWGLSSGGVGGAVLLWECPGGVSHTALFHLLPWAALGLVGALLSFLIPNRSYAP